MKQPRSLKKPLLQRKMLIGEPLLCTKTLQNVCEECQMKENEILGRLEEFGKVGTVLEYEVEKLPAKKESLKLPAKKISTQCFDSAKGGPSLLTTKRRKLLTDASPYF